MHHPKDQASTYQAIKRVPPVSTGHTNIDVLYVPNVLKNKSDLGKMYPGDTNVFALNIFGKFKIDLITYIQCAQ